MRIPCVAFAVILSLLSGCATPRASEKHDRYETTGSSEPEEEGCRPLMDPLVHSFDFARWEEKGLQRRHSCWHRLWEVPTAIVVYPVLAGAFIGLVTAPVWAPLLFLH